MGKKRVCLLTATLFFAYWLSKETCKHLLGDFPVFLVDTISYFGGFNLSEQMKKGNVVFRSIDISKKENEKIAEKYQVTWSSLFIVKYKDGQESDENMTKFAFGNARKSPDTFKSEIVKTVQNMLK